MEQYLERYRVTIMLTLSDSITTRCLMPEPVIYGNVNRVLGIVTEAAKQHGKLAALTEAGYEGIPDSTWWTEAFGRR